MAGPSSFRVGHMGAGGTLPTLLAIFALNALVVRTFGLIFRGVNSSLNVSSDTSLVDALPNVILNIIYVLCNALYSFVSPGQVALFNIDTLIVNDLLKFFNTFGF